VLLLALPIPQFSLRVMGLIANIIPRPGLIVAIATLIFAAACPMLAILIFVPPLEIAVQPFRLHEGFDGLPVKFLR
jgi:hypothetical protein